MSGARQSCRRWLPVLAGLLQVGSAASLDQERFEADVGLPASAVQDLQFDPGSGHYRMRVWRFRSSTAQLWPLLQRWQLHPVRAADPYDQAIARLARLADPFPAPAHSPFALLARRPRQASLGQLLWWLLPPYRQVRVACHPDGRGFAFRSMVIEAPVFGHAGRREVRFAAGGTPPADAGTAACAEAPHSTFYLPLYGILGSIIPGMAPESPLPFPFAERSFDELVSATLPSSGLRYHGTFYVDSSHYFRFELERAAFERLMRQKAMRPLDPADVDNGFGQDAARLGLDWWPDPAAARQLQWYQFCQRFGHQAGFMRAAWQDGTAWWLSDGTRGPAPGAESCDR